MKAFVITASLLWWSAQSRAQGSTRQPPLPHQLHNLNFSSSSPHIFSSTFGLLQQWSNTFYRYGHAIVPCEIPINTNLYHARMDGDMPPSPEWFAFDAAMSYSIAGVLSSSHLLTYRTTKNVKVIYFDGTSAALDSSGNMDSQMVFIFNSSANVPNDPVFGPGKPNNRTSGDPNGGFLGSEYDRADALCAYIRDKNLGGRGWGYEGIVRMNAGFEVIWCDFESPSAQLVSWFNTSVPLFDSKAMSTSVQQESSGLSPGLDSSQKVLRVSHMTDSRPRWQQLPFVRSAQLGWLTASAHRYGFAGGMPGRGETRVKPDSCGIWSFYDPGLIDQERNRVTGERQALDLSSSGAWEAPENTTERNAALQKLSRRRRSHRADHVSERDGRYMLEAIEQRLRASLDYPSSGCSGVDWHQISEEIMLENSPSLKELLSLLKNVPENLGSDDDQTWRWLLPVREQIHLMMMPYYQYPSYEDVQTSPEKAFDIDSPEAGIAFNRCRDQYLPLISTELSESEIPIYSATVDVLEGICQVVLSTFLAIESTWYASFDKPSASAVSSNRGISRAATKWQHNVEELMAWLGWVDQWTACDPGCGPSELCWIPMWPLSFMTQPERGSERTPDHSPGEPLEGRPEGRPEGPPGRGPPPHYGPGRRRPGYGPGHGDGYRRPPPGFGTDDSLLWEPQCVNQTQMLLDLASRPR